MKVRIEYTICNACGLCREACPEWAISQKYLEPRHLYDVHPSNKCFAFFQPLEALYGTRVSTDFQ